MSHRPGAALTSPEATRTYLRLLLAERTAEVFGALFVDSRHRVLAVEELFQGTIDGAAVHPRVVVQKALVWKAGAVLLFGTHRDAIRFSTPGGLVEVRRDRERFELDFPERHYSRRPNPGLVATLGVDAVGAGASGA